MERAEALPTLENLTMRTLANRLTARGDDVADMRFATLAEASEMNRAYGADEPAALKREAYGVEMLLDGGGTENDRRILYNTNEFTFCPEAAQALTGRGEQTATIDNAIEAVRGALEDQSTRRVEHTESYVTIVESTSARDLDLTVDGIDPEDPTDDCRVTLTIPTKFRDTTDELATLSRASAHLEQVIDLMNPNHVNAWSAGQLPAEERAESKAFASADLVAQHAAMNNVTRAGGTWEPMSSKHNDPQRNHWANQVQSDAGLRTFAEATDRCTRVVAGEQPTPALERTLELERDLGSAERLATKRAEGVDFGPKLYRHGRPDAGPPADADAARERLEKLGPGIVAEALEGDLGRLLDAKKAAREEANAGAPDKEELPDRGAGQGPGGAYDGESTPTTERPR